MDVEILSRIQFAFTVGFHYIYPPLSIGLGIILVIMEGTYLKTGNKLYENMTRFWVKVFALTFAMGVATGIVMEFEFGTNWARYSRFVGDVFGSALAAEGIFAFFLESGFLAILVFGWDKVSPRMHFISTILVAFGATLSAVWIVVANSWQQTPAGYHIVGTGEAARAEITDFWELVFNPSSMDRLSHVLSGCWQAGAFLVISVGAYYLLKKRHEDFAKASIKIGLVVAVVASLAQLATGHQSAVGVAEHQPSKLAAFEAHFDSSAVGDMWLFGWVDEENQEVLGGIKIPGMLSWLTHFDAEKEITGLNAFPEEDQPAINATFQFYHFMVAIGMTLIAISLFGVFLWWRGKLFDYRWYLIVLAFAVVLPQFANQLGWAAAEVGRQPWIVWGELRTADAFSRAISAGDVWFSLVLFFIIYGGLFVTFLYLLDRKIKHGPVEGGEKEPEAGKHAIHEINRG
ncbi:MAG: cytochrome ubiquinol oxidase subunit I [Ignavibacteriales bacterium]|nr:cytochrome ubiquinol oxidase subunit I [Ignavibacteriales bacterium]